jgi:3-deoxy-D-manno-octulosonate 8-phosphate phosphatase KdsC-like HAD superfamily phosphatase
VNDAAAMALCGLRACPADAVPWLKQQANVQLRRQGGAGCVRELIDDYILPVRPR